MRAEFQRTLGYSTLARWSPDAQALLREFDRGATRRADPPPCADPRLRCSDADDQVFVDLAVFTGATALITHDRALLKLAGAALQFNLRICRPAEWLRPMANGCLLGGEGVAD
ncbi:MAG: PIN domain-containing protein, partial [Rubrivivax sp.]